MQFLKKYESSLIKVCKNYLLPLLMCFSVMRIIISTYFDDMIITFTVLSLLCMSALFFIYEKIKSKKIVRGIVFLLIAAVVLVVCRVLMSMGWESSGMWFMNWFYVSGGAAGRVNEYTAIVFIFFSFFLASVVYYFSVIRFRASGLMLAVLLPFIIYGKRSLSIADFDMVLMVTVYLALVVHGKLTADDVKHDTVFNFSYVIACLVFVTFVGMLTMFVPKPEIKSYLENNLNFFDLRINGEMSAFSNLNEESSDRFGSNATGELLFKASTNSGADILYLRRQTFDEFRNDRWVVNENIYQRMNSIQPDPSGSARSYFNVMKSATEQYISDDVNVDRSFDYYSTAQPYSEENLSRITLTNEETFKPAYVCAELNIEISGGRNSIQIHRTNHSEAYSSRLEDAESSYYYYYYPVTNDLADFARGLPFDTGDFVLILADMRSQSKISQKNYNSIVNTIDDFTSDEYYVISDRMRQLAQELTKNCKNDYEKAEALVNYFATNGYTYDMDYVPPDESIDYFMFTSKIGSCTSYATAMTLMARSVGLPARYVEGFAAYEKDGNDQSTFVVKDTNAHAFVECYIAGVGWMTFDPTVPEYRALSNSGNGGAGTIRTVAEYLGKAALFIGAGFVLIFIVLLDRIDEILFRIRNHFKPLDRRTILLYQRVIKLLNRSHNKTFDGHTPELLDKYIKTELGANVEKLIELFQITCFGSQQPENDQFEQAYEQYRKNWRALSAGKRVKKARKREIAPHIQGNL